LHRSTLELKSSRKPGRLHVKRLVLCLTTVVLFGACESTTDPFGGFLSGGGSLTATQATGNWRFTLTRTTTLPCSTPALASGSVINTRLDVLSDGSVASTSSWQNPVSGVVHQLSETTLTPTHVRLGLRERGDCEIEKGIHRCRTQKFSARVQVYKLEIANVLRLTILY